MSKPAGRVGVTVFMPAYNAAAHLAEAVESVLAQSHADFELLVIDDGSTDSTPQLLRGYARQDRRVRVLRHPRNRGLALSFAHGYAEAKGRYIARMDADDVCEPRRLERQLSYLRAHPQIAVLGSWLRSFGAREGVMRLPWLPEDILCEAVFQNPLAHPSVMLDRQRLPGLPDFRRAYQPADDYDLWSRWLRKGLSFAALPEPLLRYRLHAGQISRSGAMELGAWRVRKDWLSALNLKADKPEAALHQRLCLGQGTAAENGLTAAWARKLLDAGLVYGMPSAPWRRRLAALGSQGSGAWSRLISRAAEGPSAWSWEWRRTKTRFLGQA